MNGKGNLDFKISPCSEFCIFLLGDSPASEFYMPTFRNTLFHLHRRGKQEEKTEMIKRPTKLEQTACSETSAHKIQTPGNHPKERIQKRIW